MKTEVYSWRVDPDLKGSLEHAARSSGKSVASLLDEIVRSWLDREGTPTDDGAAQRRLHTEARRTFGTLQAGDEWLAEEASSRLRRKLQERRAAGRPR